MTPANAIVINVLASTLVFVLPTPHLRGSGGPYSSYSTTYSTYTDFGSYGDQVHLGYSHKYPDRSLSSNPDSELIDALVSIKWRAPKGQYTALHAPISYKLAASVAKMDVQIPVEDAEWTNALSLAAVDFLDTLLGATRAFQATIAALVYESQPSLSTSPRTAEAPMVDVIEDISEHTSQLTETPSKMFRQKIDLLHQTKDLGFVDDGFVHAEEEFLDGLIPLAEGGDLRGGETGIYQREYKHDFHEMGHGGLDRDYGYSYDDTNDDDASGDDTNDDGLGRKHASYIA